MEVKQKHSLEIEKDGKLLQVVVDNDMPLGVIFDCLMEVKGWVVDRMVKAHQEEVEAASEKMAEEEKE